MRVRRGTTLRAAVLCPVLTAVVLGLAGCGDDATTGTGASTTTTSMAGAASSTSTTAASTTTKAIVFPAENRDLTHGGSTWAVVLAAAAEDTDDPILEQAQQAADAAGYSTGPTNCDQGAPEALGFAAGSYTVSVYLRSESDARTALDSFHRTGWSGGAVAQVTTYCLD